MAPSRMSRDGRWGKKSLPTKKHRNTKSSTTRSKSYPNGTRPGAANTENSFSRYSRRIHSYERSVYGDEVREGGGKFIRLSRIYRVQRLLFAFPVTSRHRIRLKFGVGVRVG